MKFKSVILELHNETPGTKNININRCCCFRTYTPQGCIFLADLFIKFIK